MASKGRNCLSVRRTEGTQGYKNRKEGRVYSKREEQVQRPRGRASSSQEMRKQAGYGLEEMRLRAMGNRVSPEGTGKGQTRELLGRPGQL